MSRARRGALCAVIVVLALAASSLASDAGSGVELDWVAPDGCATGQEVEARIDHLLEGSSKPAQRLVIRARVGHEAAKWRVTLQTEQHQTLGQREIRAESCAALADAVALVVALAIDPEAVLQNRAEGADAGSNAPPEAAPPVPPPAPPPRVVQPKRKRRVPKAVAAPHRQTQTPEQSRPFALGVAAAMDLGRLPGVAFGESLGLALGTRRARFELTGVQYWPQTAAVPGHPDATGRFRLTTVGTRACYRSGEQAWEVTACGGADAGLIRGRGQGVRTPGAGDAWLFSPALGGAAFWRPSPELALFLRGDLLLSLGRRPFEIDGVRVFEPSRLTGALALGGEVRF